MATSETTAEDGREQSAEHPDAEYVHELSDAERKRRQSPWGHDCWDDVDLDAVECKTFHGSESGSLACHGFDCPGGELVELLGQPVDFEPGHPGDFCEVYECIGCGRTGKNDRRALPDRQRLLRDSRVRPPNQIHRDARSLMSGASALR